MSPVSRAGVARLAALAAAAVIYWCVALYLILLIALSKSCAPVAAPDGPSIDACLRHKQMIVIAGFAVALLVYSIGLWRIARRSGSSRPADSPQTPLDEQD